LKSLPQDRFVDVPVRVRYAETDRMGIAYHANYFVWFEMGRTEVCRAAGVVYKELEESGYLLMVADLGARYLAPALYDDELLIRTRIGEMGSRTIRFEYELRRGTTLVATGFTRHLYCSNATRRSVRAPEEIRKRFELFAGFEAAARF